MILKSKDITLNINENGECFWSNCFGDIIEIYRLKGPAISCSNGREEWYKYGTYHRLGGPAVRLSNGDKYWFEDGKLLREVLNDL